MNIKQNIALCFDDVVIEPEFSSVKRGEADVTPKPFKNLSPKIPIISSPMSSVTEKKMINAMFKLGGIGVHHRYCDIDLIMKMYDTVHALHLGIEAKATEDYDGGELVDLVHGSRVPVAVGSIPSHKDAIDKLLEYGHRFFCVDVANGTSQNALDTVKYIREKSPEADIMSGSIATKAQAKLCILAGANILRIGVGSGSVCLTRVVTGCGVPLLQSIIDIRQMIDSPFSMEETIAYKDIILVADGGIRGSGDIAKAIAGGVDYVILGRLLAGSDESSGKKYMVSSDGSEEEIKLVNIAGLNIILDAEIADEILNHKYKWVRSGESQKYLRANGVQLHRYIYQKFNNDYQIPDDLYIDHINRNPLDNRICNTRLVTRSGNGANRGKMPHNTTGYKGVTYHKSAKKYQAQIGKDGATYYIGTYKTVIEAAIAYDKKAIELYKELAVVNFPEKTPKIEKIMCDYYGMASSKALVEENGKNPTFLHQEGIETTVSYTGPVINTINKLINGLKQALFYTGSHNLEELKDSTFRVVSNNGLIEGSAHGNS